LLVVVLGISATAAVAVAVFLLDAAPDHAPIAKAGAPPANPGPAPEPNDNKPKEGENNPDGAMKDKDVRVEFVGPKEDGELRPPANKGTRSNPPPLTVKQGAGQIQLQYVRGLVHAHDYQPDIRTIRCLEDAGPMGPAIPGGKKPPGGGMPLPRFARLAQPHRMVVCSAVFPMAKQVEAHRAALQYKSQRELFEQPDDLPRPLGINVRRYELGPDGQRLQPEGTILIQYQPEKREVVMTKRLRALLRDAMYDEDVAWSLEPYLFEGLAMPTPRLANTRYSKIELAGIDPLPMDDVVVPGVGPPMGVFGKPKLPGKQPLPGGKEKLPGKEPKLPGIEEPEPVELRVINLKQKDLQNADRALAERLFSDKFNVFHMLGHFRPSEPGPGPGPRRPSPFFSAWELNEGDMPKGPPRPGGPGPAPAQPFQWDRDGVVRFLDPDVEPGKTYQYEIQVRLANPNYKKRDAVKLAAESEFEELPLDPVKSWVPTAPITIPSDYHVYLLNQPLLDGAIGPAKLPKGMPSAKVPKDQVRFQVHRWIDRWVGPEGLARPIGSWVIAEQIDVRRGEAIGVNAPATALGWIMNEDRFRVLDTPIKEKKGPKSFVNQSMIKIDLLPESGRREWAPVLVDFHGNQDETAVEALILTGDGRLKVMSSDESDDESRIRRVNEARQRVREFTREPAFDLGPKGPFPN
jgi:hypothetical protein